jgi:hypothetical protein
MRSSSSVRTKFFPIILCGLPCFSIAACKQNDTKPIQNEATANIALPDVPEPEPAHPLANAATEIPKVKAGPEPSAEQQILDDADATGMTSRVARDDAATEPTGNSS